LKVRMRLPISPS